MSYEMVARITGERYANIKIRKQSIGKDCTGKKVQAGQYVTASNGERYIACYRFGVMVLKKEFTGWYLDASLIKFRRIRKFYRGNGLVIVGDIKEYYFHYKFRRFLLAE